MKRFYLRNYGFNRIVLLLSIFLLAIVGISVFLHTPLLRTGCGPVAIRLVDEFKPENVEGTPEAAVVLPGSDVWRFDETTGSRSGQKDIATGGWQAGAGVSDLDVQDGCLVGRSTSDCPIIHVERTSRPDESHQIYAFEIRMRVSGGTKLAVAGDSSEKVDFEKMVRIAKTQKWFLNVPLKGADNEMQTYTFCIRFPGWWSDVRHLLIRPTDVEGATFAIESIRLLSRTEYFSTNPPMVSWLDLKSIYHQTLVATTPEVIRFPLRLPDRPWLDLALGTIEDYPVTFQVKIRLAGGREEDTTLLERTITTPRRWEPVQVDLSDYARKDVIVSISLASEKAGTVGFWGSPVIRNSGSIPPAAISDSAAFSIEPPQGVILIWVDALRWDHLKAYGYSRETAPVLSRMAAEGALFHDCVSQATWTLLSTSSLLTSLYVTTHGVVDQFTDVVPISTTILPEVFHDAGYATLSFSSVWFVGRYFNMHQGFEESHEYSSSVNMKKGKTARGYIDRLLPWLEAHREVPFFVFLHVFDPHAPYEPYPPYDSMWADPARKKKHEEDAERVKEFVTDPQRKNSAMATQKELEEAGIDPDEFISLRKDWYDGSIRGMNAEIGRLFERLAELGLDEKTLVIFISDHGEEFLDHGGMSHATTVYSELTHVPLIVRWPGVVPAGAEVFETVRTIDLMPTILELCRLPLPKGMQGQSLVPLLINARRTSNGSTASGDRDATSSTGQWRNEPAVSELLLPERVIKAHPEVLAEYGGSSYAIILDGWKLNYYTQPIEGHPEYELYDHRKDPLDKVNLADKHPEIVKRLAEELKAWKEMATAASLTPDSELEKKLSSEELEHLRSLGYIK